MIWQILDSFPKCGMTHMYAYNNYIAFFLFLFFK